MNILYKILGVGICLNFTCMSFAKQEDLMIDYEDLNYTKIFANKIICKIVFINKELQINLSKQFFNNDSIYLSEKNPLNSVKVLYDAELPTDNKNIILRLDLHSQMTNCSIINNIPIIGRSDGSYYIILRKNDILVINFKNNQYYQFSRDYNPTYIKLVEIYCYLQDIQKKIKTLAILNDLPSHITTVKQLRQLCSESDCSKASVHFDENVVIFPKICYETRNIIEKTSEKKVEIYNGSQWNQSALTIIQVAPNKDTKARSGEAQRILKSAMEIIQVALNKNDKTRFKEVQSIPKSDEENIYIAFTPKEVMYLNFSSNEFYSYLRSHDSDRSDKIIKQKKNQSNIINKSFLENSLLNPIYTIIDK